MVASLAAMAATAAAADAPERLPVEHFTRPADISGVAVSPDGKRMAMLLVGPKGKRRLGVMDLDPVGEPRVIAAFGDADINDLHWVNAERLVYQAAQRGPVVRAGGVGVFAINHDGSLPRQLIAWRWATEGQSAAQTRILPYGWFFDGVVGHDSSEVRVHRVVWNSSGDPIDTLPARIDTLTGALRNLSQGMPEHVVDYWLNPADEPALLESSHEGRSTLHWRPNPQAEWTALIDYDSNHPPFNPQFIDADGRIVVSAHPGGDTKGLHLYDPVKRELAPEPLLGVKGFDIKAAVVRDSRSMAPNGVRFTADRPMTYWFDAALDQLQRSVDAALPAGRSNRMYCGRCSAGRFVVVLSSSDRQPGELYLLDRSKPSLSRIGAFRPWIAEATQGTRTLHRVAMRDGLVVPVYITHPAGAKPDEPLPAVVLVHGGPWVRGTHLGWHAEPQFLASRGYRVIEPEFRGSTGYGDALFKAGWKQWGRAMQDDLVDALQWAAGRKLVDAGRACVMGGSYGGYAALMAPITHPGAWRCAVSFAGVTDINLMYDISWSDFSEEWKRYGMPALVGDQKADAAMLAAASPLQRVAEIKVPVLLAHGGEDRRVPIAHANAFTAAARKAGVDIERLDYLDEGHGFYEPDNQSDFYRHVERFLGAALKPRP